MTREPLSLPGEIWKTVPDPYLDQKIEASSLGRIRREAYQVWAAADRKRDAHLRNYAALVLKPQTYKGYLRVSVKRKGKFRPVSVHFLVCAAFHGPKPAAHFQAAHEDGIKRHCQPENLAWKTPKENSADAIRHGTIKRGAESKQAKLDDRKVMEMRAEYDRIHNYSEIARRYGVTQRAAILAIQRKTWKHVA